MIHETAIIEKGAQIGTNVSIGAYAIIEGNTTIGDNTIVASHAIIHKNTEIAQDCIIDNFAVIGGDPQDISFNRDNVSGVKIGAGTIIREHVTIHRASVKNTSTIVGNNCYIMACAHIGHDCLVKDHVILANCALLGGFVQIDNHCFIGGGASVHQHVHIGEYTILGGYSATSLDLPPYTMAAGPSSVIGLNLVGLKRANWSSAQIAELKKCLALIYNTSGKYSEVAQQILESNDLKFSESKNFLNFFISNGEHGIAPLRSKKGHKKH
ncbi:MAG: acyl-ACP--UDP-N-acetylglucosamine O-acyltransferase [Opitutales bacterium]|nr:acyl-ACP--UDP-N-acetylglucosamine O-acyltransferase [Opitutales bacterium]